MFSSAWFFINVGGIEMKYKQIIFVFIIVIVCIATIILHMFYFYRNPSLPNWYIRYLESSQSLIEMQIPTESLTRDHLYFRLINNTDCLYVYGWGHQFFIRDRHRWRPVAPEGIGIDRFFFFDIGLVLHPNSYSDIGKNLANYSCLPYGEYAIIKEVTHYVDRTRLNVVGRFTLEPDS